MSEPRKPPRVRRDGRCYVCKGPRTLPKTRQKGVLDLVYLTDPFCSNACARAYYGNPIPSFAGAAAKK